MRHDRGCGRFMDDHGKGRAGVALDGKVITGRAFKAAAQPFVARKAQARENTRKLAAQLKGS